MRHSIYVHFSVLIRLFFDFAVVPGSVFRNADGSPQHGIVKPQLSLTAISELPTPTDRFVCAHGNNIFQHLF
jgi:hypothetical protein